MIPLEQPGQAKTPRAENPLRPFLSSIAVVVVVAAVYGLIVAAGSRLSGVPDPEAHEGVGQAISHLELRPLTGDGSPVSLLDLQNHVTLLNFWGTWCGACRNELPHIAGLRQRFAGQRAFGLLAVSRPAGGHDNDVQSLQEETAALLKRLNLSLPTYYDPDDATESAVQKLIGEEGYPTTVLLDRRGVIRAVWVGYRPGVETEMERHISMVLDERMQEATPVADDAHETADWRRELPPAVPIRGSSAKRRDAASTMPTARRRASEPARGV
jgi:thiol-disulfide isomerase/thioredoxin